jgi:methylated-DNA-[protein]-cysteine S-methyltransferase
MIPKFQEKVYKLCKKVPKGKVTTYKIIAKKLKTKAYRAVGSALNKNRNKSVPCHRVVNSNGFVGGFSRGVKNKIKLLKKEGIEIKNKRINLRRYLFTFSS